MTKKQKKALRRILFSAAALIILLLLPLKGIPKLLAYLALYGYIGGDVLQKAFRSRRVFDENLLMSLATLGAFLLAILTKSGDYLEAIAVMLFYQTGELFQSLAVGKSRRSIQELMDIRPDTARLESGELTDPAQVAVGTHILVNPGEKVPLDGIVVLGSSALDTAALTGESLPRQVGIGDSIYSGTVNLTAPLTVQTTKPFGESTASKILELVENAASRKSRTEGFLSRFSMVYTPLVCAAAAAVALVPPVISLLLGQDPGFTAWLYRALTFLVVSCPCALVISIPLTFFAALGGASRQGILIKGANYLEALSKTAQVAFDKTGTLTVAAAGKDAPKPTAKAAVEALQAMGIQPVMLSGDTPAQAAAIASALGIRNYHAALLPQDKVSLLEDLMAAKAPDSAVIFVGDGINDAPVLRRSDVGVAMGALGTDAAIEAADVVLMDDDPLKLTAAISLSRRCMGIVRQNLVFSLGIKIAVMVLTAFGISNMWLAIFADVGVMVLCVLNASRALRGNA